MKQIALAFFIVLFVLTPHVSLAQIPRQMSYQGVIVDASGHGLSDGQHVLKCTIYGSPSGHDSLYSETQITTSTGGVVSLVIGATKPISTTMDFSQQYWLSVSVDGSLELSPRTAFTSVPYALHSSIADVANSVMAGASGVVTSVNEVDGPIRIVGDSTTLVTQDGRLITISSVSSSSGGSIAALQSPQNTISIIYPSGPVTRIDVADTAITAAKLNSMGAATGQILTFDGRHWAPKDPLNNNGSDGWQLGGNSGTLNGTDFIGTLDSQALDLRTQNIISLRLNPNGSIQRTADAKARGRQAIDLQITQSSTTQLASGDQSVIGGGEYNTASGSQSVVSGGVTNSATGSYASVGGGGNNSATNSFAVISGGGHNTASAIYASIGGGESNLASGNSSHIGGGVGDTVTKYGAVIAGGTNNMVAGVSGTISGGSENVVDSNYYGVIGGGGYNIVGGGDGSTISGGINGIIKGEISTLGGGYNNYVHGDASSIIGGAFLRLNGNNSVGFLGGRSSADSAVVSASKTAFFGNVDLWIGSTDSMTHSLRLYEAQNGGITYPGTNTNFTAFKAASQSADINYTLPPSSPSANGALLTSTSTGEWSWSANAVWDGANNRLGLNTTTPAATADVNGDLAMREHQVPVAAGANHNLSIGAYSVIQLTNATGAFTISGISAGISGKIVILYNATGQTMTISNADANSAAPNRIYTGNANAYTTPGGYAFDTVTLLYSASKAGWLLISHN